MVISTGGRCLSVRYYRLLYYLAGLLKKQKNLFDCEKNRNIQKEDVLNSQKIWVANRENLHYNKEN